MQERRPNSTIKDAGKKVMRFVIEALSAPVVGFPTPIRPRREEPTIEKRIDVQNSANNPIQNPR